MSIVHEIAAAIQRNPKINRVMVCQREYGQIHAEFAEMVLVKWSPLWDDAMKRADIKILGRPVRPYYVIPRSTPGSAHPAAT